MMQRGFTLIEVLITAAIVATLASIALPLSEIAIQRGKKPSCAAPCSRSAMRSTRTNAPPTKAESFVPRTSQAIRLPLPPLPKAPLMRRARPARRSTSCAASLAIP